MIKTPLSTMMGGAFWTPSATIIGGTSKTFDQLIKSLFANGEQGFVYDPNDLTTMYQDAAGTVPVTAAGQPVGLMLDKSEGLVLGSELITGGNFEAGLIGIRFDGNGSASTWELNALSPISGTQDAKLTKTASGAARPGISFGRTDGGGVVGALYELSFDFKVVSGNIKLTDIYNGIDLLTVKPISGLSGRYTTRYIQRKAENCVIYFGAGVGVIQLDNISLRRVSGSHAYQTTSSMRPLLTASPQRLDFDTVDDKLITNLPEQLTGCTVIRAVPNVGAQILTNQTIPTPYKDNQDHCGLIVINRALTPNETSAITAEFNKRAGV